jgi:hypothetical protein
MVVAFFQQLTHGSGAIFSNSNMVMEIGSAGSDIVGDICQQLKYASGAVASNYHMVLKLCSASLFMVGELCVVTRTF